MASKGWCEGCVENSFLRHLFPAKEKSIVVLDPPQLPPSPSAPISLEKVIPAPALSELADTDVVDSLPLDRNLSDQLEIDDAGSQDQDTAGGEDDQTDHSEDTVVASHDNEEDEEEQSTPLSSPSLKLAPQKQVPEDVPVEAPPASPLSTPSRPASLRKSNSILYEFMPVKVTLMGNVFDTSAPEISAEEREAKMVEIADDPTLLVGWQIELLDKVSPEHSLGIRAVSGVKKMRGQAYKYNIIAAEAVHQVSHTSPMAGMLTRSTSNDDESDSPHEKWSALRVNGTTNKAGWPFKLLRRLEIDE